MPPQRNTYYYRGNKHIVKPFGSTKFDLFSLTFYNSHDIIVTKAESDSGLVEKEDVWILFTGISKTSL